MILFKAYEDMNIFQKILYRLRLKKWLSKEIKKDFYYSEFRRNNPRSDSNKSFNEYLKENF